jgi:hypothetical protein
MDTHKRKHKERDKRKIEGKTTLREAENVERNLEAYK